MSLDSNTFSPHLSKITILKSLTQLIFIFTSNTSFLPSELGEKTLGTNSSPHWISTAMFTHSELTHPLSVTSTQPQALTLIKDPLILNGM